MNAPRPLLLVALAALLLGSGCATFNVQRTRLDGVKSAAVVGYEAFVELGKSSQPRGQAGGIGNMINAANTMNELSSGEYTAKRIEQATKTYDMLLQHLTEGTGWDWMGREAVTSTPAYSQVFQSKRSSLATFGQDFGRARLVPNLLQPHDASRLSKAERDALMDALRVDALAVVRVRYAVGKNTGFAINGMGKTGVLPKAIVDITVWDRQGEAPIWRDNDAAGETASVGVETTMGVVNDDQLLQGMEEAAQSAYRAMMQRYLRGPGG